MKKDQSGNENYVHRVRDNIQKYVDELIGENEKLHALVEMLEETGSKHQNEAVAAKEELDRQRSQRDELRQQIEQAQEEHDTISSRYHEIERQNNDLANLYVASYRLHESLSREEIIGVIQEIVINLIGSEELAIFERANDELDLIASHGIDLEQLRSTMLDSKGVGSVRDVAAGVMDSGACYVASPEQRAQSESNLSACVPLVLNGESIGAIAVFRLLAHKPEFEPLDLELFDLLASHAAVALHYSKRDAADASS